MAGNRAIAYMGARKLEVQNLDFRNLLVRSAASAITAPSSKL